MDRNRPGTTGNVDNRSIAGSCQGICGFALLVRSGFHWLVPFDVFVIGLVGFVNDGGSLLLTLHPVPDCYQRTNLCPRGQ